MRGLYAIIDPEVCRLDPEQVALAVLRGGCATLQLRDKRSSDAELVPLASVLAMHCRRHSVPFILNDRFWLAAQVGAQGAHIGQTDHPVEEARRALGPKYSLGVSTHSFEQAREAQRRGADLIGFGPVFATSSKQAPDPVVGLAALQAVVEQISIPVVAIGGINLERAAAVAQTRTPLAAVISAICASDAPEDATRALHAALSRRVPHG